MLSVRSDRMARKVAATALSRRAGQHDQQKEQRGNPRGIEEAPEQPDGEKTAGRSEQYAGEPISSPNGARKMPYQRGEQQQEADQSEPALFEQDFHPEV